MPEIVINQTQDNINLEGRVSIFSFNIILNPPFSPYPQSKRHISKKTYCINVLDGYALLRLETNEHLTDEWTNKDEGIPIKKTNDFGIEPISDIDKVNRRLYDKLKNELESLRKMYKFEICDKTEYAPQLSKI